MKRPDVAGLITFVQAGRRSEIVTLEWEWGDLKNRRVVWPDSKAGGMSRPMSEEAYRLLSTAARQEGNPYVLPSPLHPGQRLTTGDYYGGWCRALKAAELVANRRKTITGAPRREEATA